MGKVILKKYAWILYFSVCDVCVFEITALKHSRCIEDTMTATHIPRTSNAHILQQPKVLDLVQHQIGLVDLHDRLQHTELKGSSTTKSQQVHCMLKVRLCNLFELLWD